MELGILLLADVLSPHSIFDYIQWGGIVALLLGFIWGLYKEWWVMGRQIKQEREDKLKWMELALRSTNLAESMDALRRERPL